MAALAKKKTEHVAAWRGRAQLRAAQEADQPHGSAVHLQHAMLEAAFTDASAKPYPGPVRAAILVGAPLALWAGLFAVARLVLHG
jgi:hypothetical protein